MSPLRCSECGSDDLVMGVGGNSPREGVPMLCCSCGRRWLAHVRTSAA